MAGDSYNISGQAGAVGPGSTASGNTLNQYVSALDSDQMARLGSELGILREAMRSHATSPEEDMAIAEIARAEVATAADDREGLHHALMKAGRWALETANAIGTSAAAAALTAALGM